MYIYSAINRIPDIINLLAGKSNPELNLQDYGSANEPSPRRDSSVQKRFYQWNRHADQKIIYAIDELNLLKLTLKNCGLPPKAVFFCLLSMLVSPF